MRSGCEPGPLGVCVCVCCTPKCHCRTTEFSGSPWHARSRSEAGPAVSTPGLLAFLSFWPPYLLSLSFLIRLSPCQPLSLCQSLPIVFFFSMSHSLFFYPPPFCLPILPCIRQLVLAIPPIPHPGSILPLPFSPSRVPHGARRGLGSLPESLCASCLLCENVRVCFVCMCGLHYFFPLAMQVTAVRVYVNSSSENLDYPVLVVVRQQKEVLSWQVPLLFQGL